MKKNRVKESLIENLRKTPIVEFACQKSGIARASYYRWLEEDADFARKAEAALSEGSLHVNDIAEAQLISAIKDRNFNAIVFWLKHHHPTYGTKIEINGRMAYEQKPLTAEDEELIREALRLALPQSDRKSDTHAPE